jgi:hypothetical protein
MTPEYRPSPHRRPKRQIQPREAILVVCCGQETEPRYFRGMEAHRTLRLTSVDIEPCSKGKSDALSVVKRARYLTKQRKRNSFKSPYDLVYCVIDVEGPNPEASLTEAMRLAKSDKRFKVVLSNPCFEFWLLLHYDMTTYHFKDCAAVVKKLKDYMPAYKKNAPGTYETVSANLEAAIENSKKVLKHHGNPTDLVGFNPSTHVHILVEKLLKMAEEAAR